MKEWFVVQTQVNSEQIAVADIKQKGFEVYYPNFLKTISHARKTKKVIKPLFPRYVFVSFNKKKDNWTKINYLRGVSSLVMLNQYLTSLPNFFVDNLKKYELENGTISFHKYITSKKKDHNFKFLLSKQRFINGFYSGIEKTNQVKLLINLFGRELYCWVSKNRIETV